MEKINIAELLKDCPKGMELDSPLFEGLEFDSILDNDFLPIRCRIKHPDGGYNIYNFTKHGCWLDAPFAKCVIFPKGKTSWEGFVPPCQFKDGDVIAMENACGVHIFIYNYTTDEYGGYSYYVIFTSLDKFKINGFCSGSTYRLATEEEKQKLFQAIKDNGYKWNTETKTLEKLPKFKVGDIIVDIHRKHIGASGTQGIISEITDDKYIFTDGSYIHIQCQDNWELVIEPIFKIGDKIIDTRGNSVGIIRKLTNEGYECHFEFGNFLVSFKEQHYFKLVPNFKVGDKIKYKNDKRIAIITGIKNNCYFIQYFNSNKGDYQNESISIKEQDKYELVSNKFDLNTLVPFESEVLVRNAPNQLWIPAFWGFKRDDGYVTTFGRCQYCIPYKGNEHLFKTADDCNEFFKTWK